MGSYKELNDAISNVLNKKDETDEFKRRLKKLIENSLDNSCVEDDIRSVIALIKLPSQGA